MVDILVRTRRSPWVSTAYINIQTSLADLQAIMIAR